MDNAYTSSSDNYATDSESPAETDETDENESASPKPSKPRTREQFGVVYAKVREIFREKGACTSKNLSDILKETDASATQFEEVSKKLVKKLQEAKLHCRKNLQKIY